MSGSVVSDIQVQVEGEYGTYGTYTCNHSCSSKMVSRTARLNYGMSIEILRLGTINFDHVKGNVAGTRTKILPDSRSFGKKHYIHKTCI